MEVLTTRLPGGQTPMLTLRLLIQKQFHRRGQVIIVMLKGKPHPHPSPLTYDLNTQTPPMRRLTNALYISPAQYIRQAQSDYGPCAKLLLVIFFPLLVFFHTQKTTEMAIVPGYKCYLCLHISASQILREIHLDAGCLPNKVDEVSWFFLFLFVKYFQEG